MAITVVGSVALDSVETPFGTAKDALGGAASYFAFGAAPYDAVNLVGVVGTDFPGHFVEMLQARNVDVRGLQTVEGGTFRWGGRYHVDMNTRDTLYTELGVFANFSPALPTDYCGADIIFLANIQPQLQLDVLRQTDPSSVKLRALDTMNYWINNARDDLTEVVRNVDLVMIAEDEVRDFANTANLKNAARYIFDLGPKMLVVKQGSYGALLFGADGTFFAAPAYPLEDVRDPTGAGDAFAGGFLGYLASQLTRNGTLSAADYRRALVHGNIIGSFACEQFGVECIRGLTLDAINARYAEFVDYTHFEGSWRSGESA